MTYDWNKTVKMTVPVGLCGWQQRGSLTINGRTTEFPVGVETELPEPVAERVKALMADAEEKAEHVQPLKPWMQYVTGADGVARWEPRLAYAETEEAVILPETTVEWQGEDTEANLTTPFAAQMVAGQEYTVVWNGDEYKCVAQAEDNGEGLVAVVLGDTESFPFSIFQLPEEFGAQMGVYAFIQRAELITSATLSITGVAEKVKTIDAKFLPAGAGGGGGVIYIDTAITAPYTEVVAYADAACTTPLTYEQGKAIVGTGCALSHKAENGGTLTFVPAFTHALDANKQVMCILSVPDESMMLVTATVDVGFAGE